MKRREGGENCITRSFMICTLRTLVPFHQSRLGTICRCLAGSSVDTPNRVPGAHMEVGSRAVLDDVKHRNLF
jgi:hypothetical protein